ncbi:hypothetical protein [Streptomyces sp. NPDC020489]|uniref:hypothetical protein n=1 Tax=Streptomyces sp. NPDC020489 TaxID=3365077 RepID=UPI0037AD67F1
MNTERPENDDDPEVGRTTDADEGAAGIAEDEGGTAAEGARAAQEDTPAEAPEDPEAPEAVEAAGAIETAEPSGAASGPAEAAEAPESSRPTEPDRPTESDRPTEPAERPEASAQAQPAAPGPEPEPAEDEVPRDGEPEAPRSGRPRTPVLVASVAAAVLLVGGGGAYLAASASGGSGGGTTTGARGDGTPPPLRLDGYTGGDEGTAGIAPGEPNPYGVTYRAGGPLADGPDEAPVYRATGQVTADEVARLAKALGVTGTPVLEGQAWKVGAQEPAGPSLQVNQQAPGAWTFHRYAPGTNDCGSGTECASDPAAPAGDPVSEDAAKKAAAPVLKAVGQDDAKVDAGQVMGAQRVVNADPVVGGLPTHGWTTGVTVNAQGEVVGGSGQLKTPAKSDTYPVVDAAKALQLLNARPADGHRMGIGGCASAVPQKDRLEAPCGSQASASTPQQETITVEKAVFGLASHYVDGRQALVPSWLFQVRAQGAQDGFTVTYPAIDPEYLASDTPSAEPTERPSPRPTGPDPDQPTAAPATRDVAVDGYTAEGDELTVSYTGGVCADYKASVVEGSGKVTVRVTETPMPDKVCILIAKVYHETLRLKAPLGDREVVGSDGKEVPLEKPGARLPGTSGAR